MLRGMVASVLSIGLAIVLGMQRGGGTLSSLLLIAAARLNYCTLAYSRNLRLDRFLFVSCADCRGRTTIQRAREGERASQRVSASVRFHLPVGLLGATLTASACLID